MKRTYVRPTAVVETFTANEYVATCGKTPTGEYIFKCDAPAGVIHYYKRNGDIVNRKSNYHPCGKTHTTKGIQDYYKGFVDRNGNHTEDDGETAYIWLEPVWGGTNGHASASLTEKEVETVRS